MFIKIRILPLIFLVTCAMNASGQVATYIFSNDTSAFVELTGGIALGDTNTEDQFFTDPLNPNGDTTHAGPGLPIGFNFIYNGFPFDVFGISANGWISLGNGTVNMNSVSNYFPLSSVTGSNFLAPFARNLQAQDSASIQYLTLGSAPNRELVIQWKNFRKHLNFNDHFNFQIHLYETSNQIEFQYGEIITNINASFVSVGMTGLDSSDFNVRSTGSSGGWSNTSTGVLNSATCTLNPSVYPPSGLIFRWQAPQPCTAPPVPGTAQTSFPAVCPNNPFILSLSAHSSGPGQTYQWQSSPDTISWSLIPGATSTVLSTTQVSPTWYRCEVTCSGQSAVSNSVFVDFNPATMCYCTQNLGGDCAGYGYMDSVSIASTTLANFHSGCLNLTAPNYSEYPPTSNLTATLMRGSIYLISVTCSFEANLSLWIDFNQSGSFDANEWTQVSPHTLINQAALAVFTVPANASPGTTKMRLRSRATGSANGATDACTQFFSGETEDYTIYIDYGVGIQTTSMLGNSLLLYPNPASTELNLQSLKALDSGFLRLLDVSGKEVMQKKLAASSANSIIQLNIENLTEGMYFIQFISKDGILTSKFSAGR